MHCHYEPLAYKFIYSLNYAKALTTLGKLLPRGDKNWRWKGGRWITFEGYVMIYCKDHPYSRGGYILEHRLVMEKKLNRYLEPYEVVHHKNGIKDDNRPENLDLMIPSTHSKLENIKHKGQTKCGLCRDANTFIRKSGRPVWYYKNGMYICVKCNSRHFRKRKTDRGPNRFVYLAHKSI